MKKKEYDVVVVRGGIAGVAAALSARREGKSTLLVEANFALGGLATLGLVAFYLPLDDGEGKQIANGISEELLRLSVSCDSRHHLPSKWKEEGKRYEVEFNPSLFSLLLEKKLVEGGVDILFGSTLIGVKKENGRIIALDLASRTERFVVQGKSFVDASGDASLCAYAGEEVLLSTNRNILTYWWYENNRVKMMNGFHFSKTMIGEYQGIDPYEVSDFSIRSHEGLLRAFLMGGNEKEDHSLTKIPLIPELRMTRKLQGKYALSKTDNHRFNPHSVGIFPNWVTIGESYELPYECLTGNNIKNLYVAGRNISTYDDEMWDVVRSIPVCAVSGEAAGLLAAHFPSNDDIDIALLSECFHKRNLIVHLDELGIK